jgi:hypothetical protein
MKDPEILALFADEEVMAAVKEIGANPAAMEKYKKNTKVQTMYRYMAAQAAQRMQSLADDSSK